MKHDCNTGVLRTLSLMTVLVIVSACGAATDSGSGSSDSNATTTAFPSSLTIASPFDTSEDSSANLTRALTTGSPAFTAKAQTFKMNLAEVLAASSSGSCIFDASLFLEFDNNADCYGPTISYQNHPDATSGPDDGSLPPGDLGLWTEDASTGGGACAAAEFNARMNGIQYRSHAALMSVASMLCAMTTSDESLPVNDTLDLLAAMDGLGLADLDFDVASITHAAVANETEYDYALEFTYTMGGEDYDIVVEMEHHPGDTDTAFQGRLSYLVNTTFDGGNCPDPEATINNSVVYSANGNDAQVEVRSATFCGHDSDGRVDGVVDPADRFNNASNPTGWGNNFSIFTTDMSPDDLSGNYVYAWQAGPNDSNSRVFNLKIEAADDVNGDVVADKDSEDTEDGDDADEDTDDDTIDLAMLSGEAFFGYGDTIQTSDGSITGFICNWAGPGVSHTLSERAQHQSLSFNTITGVFEADISNITYAPVNACSYDGTSTFVFDRDDDGSLTDENAAAAVTSDLLMGVDTDLDGTATIEERIGQSGFTLPETPVNP